MRETARALLVFATVIAVCALLITWSSQAARNRDAIAQTGAPPRSTLGVSYAYEGDAPYIAPLSSEVVRAAAEDRDALGLSMPALPRTGSEPGTANTAVMASAGSQGTEARTGPAASQSADDALDSLAASDGIPLKVTALGMLVVLIAGWTAFYLLRPQKD